MSPIRVLMAAAAMGAVASAADMAFAGPPQGHNSGCGSRCTPEPPPPPPPPPPPQPAGDTIIHNDVDAAAQAAAAARAAAEAAAAAQAQAEGGSATANSGGNRFNSQTTFEGSAPGTSAVVTTRCGWAFGGSVIGGGLSIGGNGDTCNQRQQAIEGLGNATDVYERGMFVEQYINVTPALDQYRDNAATNAGICGPDRRPASSIFAGQAGMSESLCVPNANSGTGIENNVNVQVSGLAQAVPATQPVRQAAETMTCEIATRRRDEASQRVDRTQAAWEAAGSRRDTAEFAARNQAIMDVNIYAAHTIALCPTGPRGS